MASKSLLIKIPSLPFNLDTLRPDAHLARIAGHLGESGHRTEIRDFGTLEMLQRLYPERFQRTAIEKTDQHCAGKERAKPVSFLDRWKSRREFGSLEQHQESVYREIAESIITEKSLDFIVFSLDTELDHAICAYVVPFIRYACPGVRVVGTGPLFQEERSHVAGCLPLFDCIYWGRSGTSFARWANCLESRDDWQRIPFLAYSDSVRMYITKSEYDRVEVDEVSPDYSREVYPALYDETKILYFDIEEVAASDSPGKGHIKTPERVADEIRLIGKQFKTVSYHISGSSSDPNHAEDLAREILERNLNIRYTRECHVASVRTSTFSTLSASGCAGIDFQIDSGSQRLLDRYYRHPFGVSQIEQAIRAARFSNLYTVMKFVYPSVEDDYHTMEETLRLIRRSKPHGTNVEIPAQEHRKTSDLKSRFRSKPKLRSQSDIELEYDELCDSVHEFGISTEMTPGLAFLAELSGFRGREEEFLDQTTYQLMAGDIAGVESLIVGINKALRGKVNPFALTPFTRLQHVVGN
jgi:hypothetical protein